MKERCTIYKFNRLELFSYKIFYNIIIIKHAYYISTSKHMSRTQKFKNLYNHHYCAP